MATRIVPDYGAGTIASALAGFGLDPALGAGDTIQLRDGNHAGVGLVVACNLEPHADNVAEAVVLGDTTSSSDVLRVQPNAVTIKGIVVQGSHATKACIALNVNGCTVGGNDPGDKVTFREYKGKAIYSTTDSHNIIQPDCDGGVGATPAVTAIDCNGGAGGGLANPTIYGTHATGIRPASGMTVYHPTITGCTTHGLDASQACTVRNAIAKDNPGIGLYLNHAGADVDYYDTHGNGTATSVVAGTLGVNAWTADPLFTDAGTDDYTLQSGSPVLDLGTNTGTTTDGAGLPRDVGGGPDLGAHERQTEQPTVLSGTAVGLDTVVVMFDQSMAEGTVETASEWDVSPLLAGAAVIISTAELAEPTRVRLSLSSPMTSDEPYRVTGPATAENGTGDVLDPAADTADFMSPLEAVDRATDLWGFLAEATYEGSDAVLPYLHQAVIVALFADARAQDSDGDPLGDGNPRGWWGDHFRPPGQEPIGSRVWTKANIRGTQDSATALVDRATEALQHLVAEGLMTQASVASVLELLATGGRRLKLTVETLRDLSDPNLEFADLWEVLRGND